MAATSSSDRISPKAEEIFRVLTLRRGELSSHLYKQVIALAGLPFSNITVFFAKKPPITSQRQQIGRLAGIVGDGNLINGKLLTLIEQRKLLPLSNCIDCVFALSRWTDEMVMPSITNFLKSEEYKACFATRTLIGEGNTIVSTLHLIYLIEQLLYKFKQNRIRLPVEAESAAAGIFNFKDPSSLIEILKKLDSVFCEKDPTNEDNFRKMRYDPSPDLETVPSTSPREAFGFFPNNPEPATYLDLDLSGLNLSMLPYQLIELFEARGSNIKTINFSGNRIRQLPAGFFASFPNLKKIFINREQRHIIPPAVRRRPGLSIVII